MLASRHAALKHYPFIITTVSFLKFNIISEISFQLHVTKSNQFTYFFYFYLYTLIAQSAVSAITVDDSCAYLTVSIGLPLIWSIS